MTDDGLISLTEALIYINATKLKILELKNNQF